MTVLTGKQDSGHHAWDNHKPHREDFEVTCQNTSCLGVGQVLRCKCPLHFNLVKILSVKRHLLVVDIVTSLFDLEVYCT